MDATSGKTVREISTGNIAIHTITLASNGKTIAVRGSLPEKEDGTSPNVIGMLDIGSGKLVQVHEQKEREFGRCHPHYAESQDGRVAEQSNGPSPVRDAVTRANCASTSSSAAAANLAWQSRRTAPRWLLS